MKRTILLIISFIFMAIVGYCLGIYLGKPNKEDVSLALLYFGMQEYEKSNTSKAMENLYTALYFNPKNVNANKILGKIFYESKMYELSAIEFQKYIENPPNDVLFGDMRGLKIEIPMAYCYLAEMSKEKVNIKLFNEYNEKIVNEFPDFKNYLIAYIKVIRQKEKSDENDIKKKILYSKFLKNITIYESEKGT